MTVHESIEQLKAAVQQSPDNGPLRVLLGDALSSAGLFEEAEAEYSIALAKAPDDSKIKLALAKACFQSGKYNKSLVLAEDMVRFESSPAGAWVLHARLLLNEGQTQKAVEQYKKGIGKDPSVADENFALRLGVGAKSDAFVVDGKVRAARGDSRGGESIIESSEIKFSDVGGMDKVKEQIRMKIIYPITHAETFKAYGKKAGGGILMYGPPGCGKTYLARATAGEIKARFMNVGLHHVLDMWIGSSEKNLHQLFETARESKPCVLFFDEVDALAASRSDMQKSGGRQIINQFLSELDGVESDNEGLLIMAATNAPWYLDPAFRRQGRFDRILFVPPPDAEARSAILRILLRGKPIENIDFELLASKTDKFSGADIKSIVEVAIEKKIAQAMKEGVPKPITTSDLIEALKDVKTSTGEWFQTARNYATYANAGGLYDDVLSYFKNK